MWAPATQELFFFLPGFPISAIRRCTVCVFYSYRGDQVHFDREDSVIRYPRDPAEGRTCHRVKDVSKQSEDSWNLAVAAHSWPSLTFFCVTLLHVITNDPKEIPAGGHTGTASRGRKPRRVVWWPSARGTQEPWDTARVTEVLTVKPVCSLSGRLWQPPWPAHPLPADQPPSLSFLLGRPLLSNSWLAPYKVATAVQGRGGNDGSTALLQKQHWKPPNSVSLVDFLNKLILENCLWKPSL